VCVVCFVFLDLLEWCGGLSVCAVLKMSGVCVVCSVGGLFAMLSTVLAR
jgi:hypothetical protein